MKVTQCVSVKSVLLASIVFVCTLVPRSATAQWLVQINGTATPYVYNGAFFVPSGPDVTITGTVGWQQAACDYRANFFVTAVNLNIDNGAFTYSCDRTDPNAINWYGPQEAACSYGTNTLDFSANWALVRGLAAPAGGPTVGDAATDLFASFTGGSFDSQACVVQPPAMATLPGPFGASVMTHTYGGSGTITRRYAFSSGSLTFSPLASGALTMTGDDVAVTAGATLPNGSSTVVSATFDNVTAGGSTTATASSSGPAAPKDFRLGVPPLYYDISTSAIFTGNVTLCFSWQEGQFQREAGIRLFHYQNAAWIDVTTSLDTTGNRVCGQVSSLSPFVLAEPSYSFTGFFQPVDNPLTRNTVKAGSAIPVRFSLSGNKGLGIFDPGYPASQTVQCNTTAPLDLVEETVAAGASSLSYDSPSDRYTYVWKSDKSWAGSCRRLLLQLNDGSLKYADFNFSK